MIHRFVHKRAELTHARHSTNSTAVSVPLFGSYYREGEAMDQQDEYARTTRQEQLVVSDEDDFDLILLGRMEELRGSMPGNERIRVTLPQHQPFHRIKEGCLKLPKPQKCQKGRWLIRSIGS